MASVITRARIDDDNQDRVLDHLLAPTTPKGLWRIQRPDGQYFHTWDRERTWTRAIDAAMPFQSQASAQHCIDIQLGTQAGRIAMRDCRPVCAS